MKTQIIYGSRFIAWLLSAVNKLFGSTYHTIMILGVVFSTREEGELSTGTKRHEGIHVAQYKECFIIGAVIAAFLIGLIWHWCALWFWLLPFLLFYILYGVECIISFVHHFFAHGRKSIQDANKQSYRNCSFEMEARENESNPEYLQERKFFAFVRYYGKV